MTAYSKFRLILRPRYTP